MPHAHGMAAYMCEIDIGNFSNPNLSVAIEKCWYFVCVVPDNFYVFSLYLNPDINDQISECLLTTMAAMQAWDIRASFQFVGDLSGHYQEWLGSTSTYRLGVAVLDFASVSGCVQQVIGQTHDLLTTDAPTLVR